MCVEIMLNAVNIAMVAFSRYITPALLTGQVFVIFIMVVAAAEAAVGLAIIIAIYRSRETIESTKADLMKW
jgi:NADH:ubiquinone oxidoreductase subunit K